MFNSELFGMELLCNGPIFRAVFLLYRFARLCVLTVGRQLKRSGDNSSIQKM